jgi:hypothetical protein
LARDPPPEPFDLLLDLDRFDPLLEPFDEDFCFVCAMVVPFPA